ncbi:hypothetical protein CYY_002177 [Polysphondylium violaceum]|uniref:Saposin B-type domain-containing protein n=1 Tax=Polysphondylium violaceum TaxID=133409 RepID=A0A8J4V9V2_9MYCE|nr:hypothetical protein CYY_002177 [Polysphondylium violaceum]
MKIIILVFALFALFCLVNAGTKEECLVCGTILPSYQQDIHKGMSNSAIIEDILNICTSFEFQQDIDICNKQAHNVTFIQLVKSHINDPCEKFWDCSSDEFYIKIN